MLTTIKKAYEHLYESANIPSGYRLYGNPVYFNKLSHFIGMKGKNYDSQEKRLLIVGRAVNGWKDSLDCTSAETFANTISPKIQDNFSWIECDKGVLRNNSLDEETGKYYWLNKSSFWRVSRQAWLNLSGRTDFIDNENDKWTDNIAWTNLYKVAPFKSGNPTTTMIKKQLSACKEILKAEIDYFNPTHILFITGYEWWFENFKDIFDTTFYKSQKSTPFAEAYAATKCRKLVVACRPERKDETAYMADVLEAFDAAAKL